jgi:hypothetical protein
MYNLDGCIVGASIAGGAAFAFGGPLPVLPASEVGGLVGCVGLGLGQMTGVVSRQPVLG